MVAFVLQLQPKGIRGGRIHKEMNVNNNLIRAPNIVTELQSSLDMSVPGELPGTLYRLYDYVMHQLQQANLKKEPDT